MKTGAACHIENKNGECNYEKFGCPDDNEYICMLN